MDLVIDANILFSALIKNSMTATLLCKEDLHLSCPEFVLDELEKHRELILKKTSRTVEEFISIINAFEELITLFPCEAYAQFLEEARELCPDPDDVMYFALALYLRCGIWSNDKALKNQNKITIYTTEEVKVLFS